MKTDPTPLRLLFLGSLLALLPACATTVSTSSGGDAPSAARGRGGDDDSPAEKVEEAEREVEVARLELALAEMEAERERITSDSALAAAERELLSASEELASFREVDQALEVERAQLTVDRNENRLISEQMDQQGIQEIYALEEEARAKDEILRRHEVSVLFASRELELAQAGMRRTVEFELPRKVEKLEWAVAKAEADLEAARLQHELSRGRTELKLMKQRHALEDALEELEEAREAAAKAAGDDDDDDDGGEG